MRKPRILKPGDGTSTGARQAQPGAAEDVVVVGAGAAGLTAAYFAAQAGAQVLVLERTREAGKKILMSGGSRCNILPLVADLDTDFFTESSRSALRAAFATWTLEGAKEWLEDDIGLALELEEANAKWFPASNSSRDVRDALVAACRRAGVQFRYDSSLEGLEQCSSSKSSRSSSSDDVGDNDGRNGDSSSNSSSRNSSSSGTEVGAAGDAGQIEIGGSRGANTGGKGKRKRVTGGGAERCDWVCRLAGGTGVRARTVVLATGGLSFPAVGTDGTGHRIVAKLGHSLAQPYAALTPLLGRHPGGEQLAGLTLPSVKLSAHRAAPAPAADDASGASGSGEGGGPGGGKKAKGKGGNKGGGGGASVAVAQRGGFLFTHKGYSGPAVLDLSHRAVVALERGETPPVIRANWTGDAPEDWDARLRQGGPALVATLLQRGGLKERLALALCSALGITGRTAAQLRKEERAALVSALTAYPLDLTGHEGYKKAEVTGGGVPLNQINCRTGESTVLPGLFLCGEIVDVFGRIGGFNFLWAWISGRAAGLGAAAAAAEAAAVTGAAAERLPVRGEP
ncbi:hypothetical protein MNEG_5163 [Monoraphidium neglectum]|uniref:Uncharacterized protein n=1 Tax=Monoraphidium neglectum TaxID=145388 RepID=A0A0D2L7G5_9CHLO|nr:hypothetical protein MNEG_5163 [Monoraphidium neglectum]KIZ02794.1 hypothetical protein MNEG_5163 [Monoraphidium neglectum]|eukprot:XP_013901813.1 hypothetical protein MNEG_5163 [Monoraphidium neglectum]